MSMPCVADHKPSARRVRLAAACVVGALCMLPQASFAQAATPFTGLAGSWRGTGRVVGTNGAAEPIKCRATYEVSPSGWNLNQSLVCASASYRFDIRSNVVTDGHKVQGTWQETTRNATGNLTGSIQPGGVIVSTVSGTGFTASLSLRTVGNRQNVSIIPRGADVTQVDISMAR